ncbi:hypothetical protein IHE45_03G045800 [Dioscorea alata]|uniref:Uncharacterized protein n=1 Tax=Dioscorea alata TaxID=55571 RepID=A0ACB7WK29_DIOAL|nr:hypothetical protein IHE45_03G045800 [Dioscorea alata]
MSSRPLHARAAEAAPPAGGAGGRRGTPAGGRAGGATRRSRAHAPPAHPAPAAPRASASSRVFRVFAAGLDNDPSAGSPTETLLRLLLPLHDKVQWTSRDVAGGETAPVALCLGPRRPRCGGSALTRPCTRGGPQRCPAVRGVAPVSLSVGCGGGSRARRPPSLRTLPARPWRVCVAAGEPLGPWPVVGRRCRSRRGVARPPVPPV